MFAVLMIRQLTKSNVRRQDEGATSRPSSVHYHHYGPVPPPDTIGLHQHPAVQQRTAAPAQVYTLPPIQV